MAAAPVKPPLHNFPLAFLKWGTKNHTTNNAHSHHRYRRPVSAEPASEPDSESDRTLANRVGSSRTTRHRFSLIPCADAKRQKSEERESEEEEVEVVQKPWNLRPRKASGTTAFSKACTANASGAAANGGTHELEGPNPNPSQSEQQQPKSMRLRGLAEGGQSVEKKKEKRKFWIALSKEEIEEDIFVMTGSRPSRRPKKRPKNVQKQLDTIFPGLWLVGVTADAYKAAESPSKR